MNLSRSLLIAAALAPASLAQTTWYVDAAGSAPGNGTPGNPFTSIQLAIDSPSTAAGDTILVLPGLYAEAVDFTGKALRVLSSGGPANTVIEAAGSVVTVAAGEPSGTEIAGFTVRGGTGSVQPLNAVLDAIVGGGVLVMDSHLLVRDCVITGNASQIGGGLYCAGGELTVEGCQVLGNTVTWSSSGPVGGGGVACTRGSLVMADSVVSGNLLISTGALNNSRKGAGIFHGLAVSGTPPTLRMRDCVIENNRAEPWARGGGVYIQTRDALVERCEVRGNLTGSQAALSSDGGGVFVGTAQGPSEAIFRECLIEGNGGAATHEGGGVFGVATLEDCVIRGNEATRGAGVYSVLSGSGAILQDCLIEENRAAHAFLGLPSGGGVYGTELFDCLLVGNRSSNSGGAATDCALHGCEVRDNAAGALLPNSSEVRGGALVDCTATDCLLVGNALAPCLDLTVDGGGAAYGSTLLRCVIISNRIDSPGLGAATRACDLDRCTVFGNEYRSGWGYSIEGPGTVHNTIIWGNETAIDIDPYEPRPSLTYCNVEEGVMIGAGNISDAPQFWAPDRLDFHLRPGSPGIDAGDPLDPLDPDGTAVEMGALPFDSAYVGLPTNYCVAKVNSLGCAVAMDYIGLPTLSGPDDFALTAVGLPAFSFAVPVWSLSAGATPLGGGLLCVGMPFSRSAVAQSGSNPTASCEGGTIRSPFTQGTMASSGLAVGTRIHAQLWYRDSHPDGTGFALTDGLDFTLRP